MAKLPLDQYLQWGSGSGKSLTLNCVLSILLDIKKTGDWKYALRHVPKRKLNHEINYGQSIRDHNALRYGIERKEKRKERLLLKKYNSGIHFGKNPLENDKLKKNRIVQVKNIMK